MRKNIRYIALIALIPILWLGCKEDPESEPRTREMEWAELDSIIRELEAGDVDVDTTSRGIFYVVVTRSTGPMPKTGDTCSVEYVGLLNGRLIDDTGIYKNNRWTFPYRYDKKVHPVLGLLDGIGNMNKGAKINMYIPSDFAYGANGTDGIPPYSTLFYIATLHDLAPAK